MINWKELSNEIRQTLPGIRLLEEEPLARHTSFRIGGPAAVFAQPSSAEELQRCCGCCLKKTSARVS